MPPWVIIIFIYIGTLCYAIASFLHLKLQNWSMIKAFLIAIPFVFIEYQFSLRGNKYANSILRLNPVQILLLTVAFYFINVWLLNFFIIKNRIIWWRELIAFILVIGAIAISTNMH